MLDAAQHPVTGWHRLDENRTVAWDKAGAPDQTVVSLVEQRPDGTIVILACGTEEQVNEQIAKLP